MSILGLLRKRSEPTVPQGPLFGLVKQALEDIRPYARSHGGDIELIGVAEDGAVSIRFRGACVGCPLSAITLKQGIEERLLHSVPGVTRVIAA